MKRSSIFVLALCALATPAAASVVCVTPDGQVHVGDSTPPGCKVQEKYRGLVKSAPGPGSPLSRRGEIEREAATLSDELFAVESSRVSLAPVDPSAFGNDPEGWQAYESAIAAHDARASELDGRRSEIRWRLDLLRRDFDSLTGQVADANGGRPPRDWTPMRCPACAR